MAITSSPVRDMPAGQIPAGTGAATSVLQSLNQTNRRLEHSLLELRDQSSADTELRALARSLIELVDGNEDIVLGAILLNQITGPYTVRHCTESAIIASLIARAMGKSIDEITIITAAALTMNVGMVRSAEDYQGRDNPLTSEERARLRRHPSDSVELLRWAGVNDEEWLTLVLLHHENDDGSGYPQGRLGNEISQNAKLIGLADRYCAFVSARNYRRSLLPPVALEKLCGETEMPIDPAVLAHFRKELGGYPPGTLVRLQNGDTGVVTRRQDAQGIQTVHALRSSDGLQMAQEHSTQDDGFAIGEALHEDHARLRFTMKQVWGERASL
ncbi:MAG: HD domain-containing phosphohydrolase [Pseudomonadota bacterium]